MKDYKRLTHDWFGCRACVDGECIIPETFCQHRGLCEKHNELVKIENEIESGQLCAREEVRKETAKEVLSAVYSTLERVFRMEKVSCLQTRVLREFTLGYLQNLCADYKVELLKNSEKLEDKERQVKN